MREKTQKLSGEEKAIKNIKKYIKQRKSRMVVFFILLVLMIATSIWMISIGKKHARAMMTEHAKLLFLFLVMINLQTFALLIGFIIGKIIMEIAGVTKDQNGLAVNMWERIQELEKEVKELKVSKQADEQQIADEDGGDSISGDG